MNSKIFYGGTILTVDDKEPQVECVAIENGIILDRGNYKEISEKYSTFEKCDLKGKTMLPSFIDPHSHITMAELFPRFTSPPVGDIDSVDKLISAVKTEIKNKPPKKGKWFIGMGYDNATFPNSKHPTRWDLDKISETIPILLVHVSGHVGVVNSLALKQLKITSQTPSPVGGNIDKTSDGVPTGLLEENAMMGSLKKKGLSLLPPLKDILNAPIKAQKMYASYGVTTAQDGAAGSIMSVLYGLIKKKMIIDVYSYILMNKKNKGLKKIDSRKVEYKNHYRVAGAKTLLDGSPQAKTAWLTKPYYISPSDDKEYKGFPIYTDDEIFNNCKECLINNWQILVHCNGDAAGDQFINQYERAMKETGIKTNLRPVMIHAQTIRTDQLKKCKEIGIYPSFFHDHTYYWGDYHLSSVLGPERGSRISPLKEALEMGISFTLHQDTPVTPPNMVFAIHNAVNRKTAKGVSIGEQFTISPLEAIKAVTINSAFQCHEEDRKGTIEIGKLADLVVLDGNPLEVEKDKIKDIKVLETFKEGTSIYKK